MYACMCLCMYVCIYMFVCACMFVCMYVRMGACVCVCVCTYVRMYVFNNMSQQLLWQLPNNLPGEKWNLFYEKYISPKEDVCKKMRT